MNGFMMQKIKCQEYDVQLSFVKEKFFDYILLTIHYTRNSKCQFLIKNIEDLEDDNFIFRTCYLVAIDI